MLHKNLLEGLKGGFIDIYQEYPWWQIYNSRVWMGYYKYKLTNITRRMKVLSKLAVLVVLIFCMLQGALAKTPNPYKVLGISKTANEDEIKKAFNKRSKKYHPDRNKEDPRAKEKFEKVVNAYELLKDPERRRMYDMTGTDDPQQAGMGGGFGGGGFGGGFPGGGGFGINMDDLFNMGFGGGGGRRQEGGRRQGGQRTYTFSFGGGAGGHPGGGGFRFDL